MGITMLVGQVLKRKGYGYTAIDPDATVYEAIELMARKNVGALPVLEDGMVIGMFSERDYARKVILHGKSSRETPVRDIMTRHVITVGPQQTLVDCMTLMTDHHIRHLPVVVDGELAGLVSIGDVVKGIISEQEFMIEQLEKYISGQR